MILTGDCLAVLGARHGIALRPQERCASLVRCARHTENKFQFEVGLRIGDEVFYAPFCEKSRKDPFDFADEKMGIADTEYSFVAQKYGVIVTLKMFIPFRPKDEDFSSVPALFVSVGVRNIRGNFRWCERTEWHAEGEVFVSFDESFFAAAEENGRLALSYDLIS